MSESRFRSNCPVNGHCVRGCLKTEPCCAEVAERPVAVGNLKPRAPGKAPLALIPLAGLEVEAAALEHGALKYWPNNWIACPRDELGTYRHALLRHAVAFCIADERDDPESGVSHLGHIRACAGIMAHILGLRYAPGRLAAAASAEDLHRLVSDAALFGELPETKTAVASEAKAVVGDEDEWALPDGLRWDHGDDGWWIASPDGCLWLFDDEVDPDGLLLQRPDADQLVALLKRRNGR